MLPARPTQEEIDPRLPCPQFLREKEERILAHQRRIEAELRRRGESLRRIQPKAEVIRLAEQIEILRDLSPSLPIKTPLAISLAFERRTGQRLAGQRLRRLLAEAKLTA